MILQKRQLITETVYRSLAPGWHEAQRLCAMFALKRQLVWSSRIFQPLGPLRQMSEKMPSSFLASPFAVRSR
jgi:hypothetical protein